MTIKKRAPGSIEHALEIALEVHGGWTEKAGRPYILHVLRVMAKMETDEQRLTAILHDVVEDSADFAEPYTPARLESLGFPVAVCTAVRALSHASGVTDAEYQDAIERLLSNELARRVKLADLEDNMDVRRYQALEDKSVPYLKKYLRAWRTLSAPDRSI